MFSHSIAKTQKDFKNKQLYKTFASSLLDLLLDSTTSTTYVQFWQLIVDSVFNNNDEKSNKILENIPLHSSLNGLKNLMPTIKGPSSHIFVWNDILAMLGEGVFTATEPGNWDTTLRCVVAEFRTVAKKLRRGKQTRGNTKTFHLGIKKVQKKYQHQRQLILNLEILCHAL